MLVAIAISNGALASHFGHCEYFEIYEVLNDKSYKKKENIKNPPHQKDYLPNFLKQHEIKVLITGSIGNRAVNGLKDLGIQVICGVSGKTEDIIEEFIEGTLVSTNEVCSEHLHHNH